MQLPNIGASRIGPQQQEIDYLGQISQALAGYDNRQQQDLMSKVFSVNPQFAQQLYGAKNDMAQTDMLQQQQKMKLAQQRALQQLAQNAGGLDAGGVLQQIAATTGDPDALLALSKYQRMKETGLNPDLPANIQSAMLYEKMSPESRDIFDRVNKVGVEKVDTGDAIELRDRTTGAVIQRIPKQLAPADLPSTKGAQTQATEKAKIDVERETAAPKVAAMVDNNIKIIDEALAMPGFDRNFGVIGVLPSIPGGEAADAATYIDQIKGTAFLTAIGEMKGSGAISEKEGDAATAAVARLQTSQSAESARKALADLRAILEGAKSRAVKGTKLDSFSTITGGSPAPTKKRFNPATGNFE